MNGVNGHGQAAEEDDEDDNRTAIMPSQAERPEVNALKHGTRRVPSPGTLGVTIEGNAPPSHHLFVSSAPINVSDGTYVDSRGQLENFEWCLSVMRELADDGKEYLSRLEEIRNGLGEASAVRQSVWNACRTSALEEMTQERRS